MTKEKGFTLIEVLVVLSVFSVLLLIGLAVQTHIIEEYRTKHAFKQLQNDLLFMQQLTVTKSESVYLTISPEENKYEIKQAGYGNSLRTKKFPKGWDVDLNTLSMPLSFTFKGNLKHPGTMIVKTKRSVYYVLFPFGKGGAYVVEE